MIDLVISIDVLNIIGEGQVLLNQFVAVQELSKLMGERL